MKLKNHYGLLRRLAVVFCLLSTASAAATQPPNPKPQAGGRTICVISLVGQKFDVQTIGLMVFGNKVESTIVGSWGIGELVVQKVGAALGRDFSVRKMAPPAPALAAYNGPRNFFKDRYGDFIAALRGHTAGCRYLVVAVPFAAEFGGTNQTIEGVGILKRSAIIDQYFLFAKFTLQLHDGETLEHIGVPLAAGSVVGSLFGNPAGQRTVDQSWWPGSAHVAARNAKLRDGTRALVSKVLDAEVGRLVPTLTQRRQ